MSQLLNSDQYKAWQIFIDRGIIPGNIRKEVASSWERCKRKGLKPDFFHGDISTPVLSKRSLETRKEKYSRLLALAEPAMKQINDVLNNNFVCLCDADGYVLNKLGGNYTSPGVRMRESDIGTTAIGLVLTEGKPNQITGAEHYSYHYHTYDGVATPICDINGSIIGVLEVCSTDSLLMEKAKSLLQIHTRALEVSLWHNQQQIQINDFIKQCMLLSYNTSENIIVLDQDGLIANANTNLINLLGLKSCCNLVDTSFEEYLNNKQDLGRLLTDRSLIDKFMLKGPHGLISCSGIRRIFFLNNQNKWQIAIMFFAINEGLSQKRGMIDCSTVLSDNKKSNALNKAVGNSSSWVKIKELTLKTANVTSNVLIEGESGTGKELIAQAIHELSGRTGPFIAVNCGAIPRELLQSELFGYVEGAFTGARKGGSVGKFEQSHKGTIFLDEIGEMPLDMQVSLLRFLQDRKIVRIGDSHVRKVDVRVIAATNRNLKHNVLINEFREDLYYRLNVINIKLPPLRERKEDIPLIACYLANQLCQELNRAPVSFEDTAFKILSEYDWPGNVRELKNIIERAIVFTGGQSTITKDIIRQCFSDDSLNFNTRDKSIKSFEKEIIISTLEKYNGNISRAATSLGINRGTLYHKMNAMRINRKQFSQ